MCVVRVFHKIVVMPFKLQKPLTRELYVFEEHAAPLDGGKDARTHGHHRVDVAATYASLGREEVIINLYVWFASSQRVLMQVGRTTSKAGASKPAEIPSAFMAPPTLITEYTSLAAAGAAPSAPRAANASKDTTRDATVAAAEEAARFLARPLHGLTAATAVTAPPPRLPRSFGQSTLLAVSQWA
jgi:hypothetical protein